MENVYRVILNVEDVEAMMLEAVQAPIPKGATFHMMKDNKWEELSTYQKTTKQCLMIEFTQEDLDKAQKEAEKAIESGEERPWTDD